MLVDDDRVMEGDRRRRSLRLAAVAGLELAVFAPLVRSGTVLLLDYADYPAGPGADLEPYAWGLAPGLTSRAPVNALLLGLFRLVSWGPSRLLPLVLVPPLAVWGFHRLFGDRQIASLGAALLFVVNPFMYERMLAGQVYLVVGVALLPLFLSLLLSTAPGAAAPVGAGLVFALLIALSPHFVFLGGVLVVAVVVGSIRAKNAAGRLRGVGISLMVAAAASLYWILPVVAQASSLGRVTDIDVRTFRTLPDPVFGLALNVVGLYGFWREGWALPKDNLPAWPVILVAILLVGGVGLRSSVSRRRAELSFTVLAAGAAGLVLAFGADGPTAPLFRALFDHLPGFRIMREPAKFEMLLALAYATAFGLGLSALVTATRTRRASAVVGVVILALPCAYTFRMFWGFTGSVRPSEYPASWTEAGAIMGDGPEKVLALPGDQYLPFSWTQNRPVANPMVDFFERDVLIDGGLGLGAVESQTADARARYLRFVTRHGDDVANFGNLVAPLAVKYVLVAKTADWASYRWLERQRDLRLIGRWPDLDLFENRRPVATAYAPKRVSEVEDWGEVVGLAEHVSLAEVAVVVRHAAPGPIRAPATAPAGGIFRPLTLAGISPVAYRVEPDGAGNVVVSEPFEASWRLDRRPPAMNLGVGLLFTDVPRRSVVEVRFERWPLVRGSYGLSAVAICVALAVMVVSSRRHRKPRIGLRLDRAPPRYVSSPRRSATDSTILPGR